MPVTMERRDQVERWIAHDPDPETRDEATRLLEADDGGGIDSRFGERLVFGTAGLRGELGAGPNRMNRVVVRVAAAALVERLQAQGAAHPLVVIGYDARRNSSVFAQDTAAVVAARGGKAIRLPGPLPTPVLAFAVRQLRADAGVMVTASHNPPADNGYKVYLRDGAQLIPPHDTDIEALIEKMPLPPVEIGPPAQGGEDHAFEGDIVGSYLDTVFADVLPNAAMAELRIVYTPLHGVGRDPFVRAGLRFGVVPHVVPSQAEPDGTFPTVSFPNPEEPGALDAALALATRINADVIIANDPDADRLAVALPQRDGTWRSLTGNEVGWLLGEQRINETSGDHRAVVTTIVSSALLSKLAADAGVRCIETLTGFKWVVRPAITDPAMRFLFGYEEALGYAVNDIVRDKDGLTAAFAFLRLVADLRRSGRSPFDQLDALAARYGRHVTRQVSVRYDGPGALDRMGDKMRALRGVPLTEVAGRKVVGTIDYLGGHEGLPPSDILRFDFDDRTRVLLRPSGTEPKLKLYIEMIDPKSDSALDELADVFRRMVTS